MLEIGMNELGSTIDMLYTRREERLDLERKVKELKRGEEELRMAILQCLGLSGLQKASGHAATASVKTSIIPIVTDWDKIHSYVKEQDRFDLLQKRLSVLAWRDLNDTGVLVPGTEAVEDVDLSLTKSSRS